MGSILLQLQQQQQGQSESQIWILFHQWAILSLIALQLRKEVLKGISLCHETITIILLCKSLLGGFDSEVTIGVRDPNDFVSLIIIQNNIELSNLIFSVFISLKCNLSYSQIPSLQTSLTLIFCWGSFSGDMRYKGSSLVQLSYQKSTSPIPTFHMMFLSTSFFMIQSVLQL